MTIKERIRSRLRWEHGKTYKGKRSGWPETVDSPVSVPTDGKEDYIETPEGFNTYETLIDRYTAEEPENVDLEAEAASRKLASEVRAEMIQSMGTVEAEKAGIDKYAEIPEPEPLLFGREKEEAEKAKIAEAISRREAETEAEAEAEEPAEEPAAEAETVEEVQMELNVEPAPEVEVPEIEIPELELDIEAAEAAAAEVPTEAPAEEPAAEEPAPEVEEPAAEEPAPEIEIPEIEIPELELDIEAAEAAAAEVPPEAPAEEPAAEEPAPVVEEPAAEEPAPEIEVPEIEIPELELDIEAAEAAAAEVPTEAPAEEPAAEEPAPEVEEPAAAESAPAAEEPADGGIPMELEDVDGEKIAMEPLNDNLHFSEQEPGLGSEEMRAEMAAESVVAANIEAADPINLTEEASGSDKDKKDKKKAKKDRDGKKKSKGLKDKLLRRRNKSKDVEEAEAASEPETGSESEVMEGVENIAAGIESGFLATKGQRQAEAAAAAAASAESLEIPDTFVMPNADNLVTEIGTGAEKTEEKESEPKSEPKPEPQQEKSHGKPKVRRRGRKSEKEEEKAPEPAEETTEDIAVVEEIKKEPEPAPEPEKDELENLTEIVMDENSADMEVSLEEAEEMARNKIKAEKEAEENKEKKSAPKPEETIDTSKIKIPFYLKNNEKKREAYIKKQVKKIRAKARKEADAIKKKELAKKKAEEAKAAKAQKKADKKAAKPELKKAKKEAKLAKKEQKAEKKAAKKEKKREKKAIRKEKWAKKPAIDKMIIRMLVAVLLVSGFVAGWMFLPGIVGRVMNGISSIPDNIKANLADKEFQKEIAEVDPRDEALLQYIENTVQMQPMETNVLEAFGIAGYVASDSANKKYVATYGDDSNPGSEELPFKTVQKGIDSMHSGGVLYLEPGVYNERLHITLKGDSHDYITIMTHSSTTEKAIIDGKGLKGDDPLITVDGSKYLTLCNLELQNAKTGIEVVNSKAIILAGLDIHDLRVVGADQVVQELDDEGNVISESITPGPRAYGIRVIGDTTTATRSILIYYNNIYNINQGSGVLVEGNTEHINMFANKLMTIGGCGIEYVGGRGVCQQAAYDAPRDCTIKSNSVGACKSTLGEGYGIKVDSTRNMTISENITYRCDWGYGILSAVGYDQSYNGDDISLKNNLTACDYMGGIVVGPANGSNGYLHSVKVMNNTCLNTYGDDMGSDFKGSNVGSLVLRKNIFSNAKASGMTVYLGPNQAGQSEIIVDGNIYATSSKAGTAKFVYDGKECTGFMVYKKASGEQTGFYTNESYATLCPKLLTGDYSYMNYGIQVGATILEPER